MKFGCLLGFALLCTIPAYSQHTSIKHPQGDLQPWEDPAVWQQGVPPSTLEQANFDLIINGFIHRVGTLTLKKNTDKKGGEFIINDTLVIVGNLIVEQNAAPLIIGPNAVLIVIGDVGLLNNIVIENGGIFIVHGDMNFHGGNSEEYENTGGELFVSGEIRENTDASGHNDWNNLDDEYKDLYDYVLCGAGRGACILPVKITFFDARVDGTRVALSWATSMEENFRHFVVERSNDGLDFISLGVIEGRGFDIYEIESKYTFVDDNPLLGFNYYRLKAVDFDDTFEYFGVKAVRVEAPRQLGVYPNPSSGEAITFQMNFNPGEYDRILITDPIGSEVFSESVSRIENRIVFPQKLRPGVYLLRYIGSGLEQTERIVVRN